MNKAKLAAAFAVAASSAVAVGAETNGVETAVLPPVVVEASRIDAKEMEMPSAVRVIGANEIAASGAHDVVELLARKSPQLHLRRLGANNPALAEVAMRGYGENGHGRTLVLVDGERLNSPDLNTPNLSRIALGSLSKVEVLSGPQSVLHGDGASAGVINIITEPQDYTRKTYVEAHGGSYETFGASVGTRGGLADEGVKYWADGSWESSDGYRDNSDYDLYNAVGGIKKEWESGTYLRFSSFYNHARYGLPGHLSREMWKRDSEHTNNPDDEYQRTTWGFNSTFNAALDEENDLRITGTFSKRNMRTYAGGDGWWMRNLYDIYSYSLTPEWINRAALFGLENEFILGLRYSCDDLSGEQRSSYAAAQRPDYYRHNADVFAMDTLHFTDWIALQLGARHSSAWAHNNLCTRDSRYDANWAMEAAVVFNPTDDAKLYLKAARTYRNPFLDEVPGRFDAGYNWVNTTILAPEHGWNVEAGFDWNATEELNFGADIYCTWLEDEIFYDAVHGNNVNYDDWTMRYGADVHAAWEREKVAGISAAVSWTRAEFVSGDFDGKLIPMVPDVTLTLNGRVWLWDECFVFGGFRFQNEMYSISDFGNQFRKVDWYGVFHVGATYEPTFAEWIEGVKISLTVDNLFDKEYCDYITYGANYYPAAGRNFMLSIRYEF